MKSTILLGFVAAITIAMTTASFGLILATAQMMDDNTTMAGNMTVGNMTAGATNLTEGGNMQSGKISGCGVEC